MKNKGYVQKYHWRFGRRVETKQSISNTRTATALYHIPGSRLVTTYLPISHLVLLSYQAMPVSLPASMSACLTACLFMSPCEDEYPDPPPSPSPWCRQAAKLIKTRARSFIVFLASWLSMTHSMHTPRIINQINTHRDMDT